MDENKIRQIIQEEIRRNSNQIRFGISAVPQVRQSTTNISANPSSVVTYVASLGAVAAIIPTGWSYEVIGTGDYLITHNLGTNLYSAVVSPLTSGSLPIASVTPGPNSISVTWSRADGGGTVDTAYQLIVSQINNRKLSYPKYDNLYGLI